MTDLKLEDLLERFSLEEKDFTRPKLCFNGTSNHADSHRALYAGDITPTEFALLAVVDSYCHYESRMCWASNNALASRLGVKRRQVIYMVNKLVKLGLLIRGPNILFRKGKLRTIWTKWTLPRADKDVRPPVQSTALPPVQCTAPNVNTRSIYKREAAAADAAIGNPRQTPQLEEDDMMDLHPLFTSALSTSSKKTTPSTFDQEVARQIKKFCVENNWMVSHQKKNWAESVRLLRQAENGPDQDTITEVISSYFRAYKEGKTKFKVTTCADLRNQWHTVVRIASKVPPPVGARATELARLSATYAKWPKVVTLEDVAVFANRVIAFAEFQSDRLMKIKKQLEEQKVKSGSKEATTRQRLIKAVGVAQVCLMGGADGFTKRYLEKVLREVRKWKDWSGSFEPFMPTLTSKHVGMKKMVLDYGNEELWNMLKELIK
jgi:hypothetical protein